MLSEFNYSKNAKQIVEEIDCMGSAVIENAVPDVFIEKVRAEIDELTEQHRGSFSLTGNSNLKSTPLGELYCDPDFNSLLKNITAFKLQTDLDEDTDKYQVLRVLNGGEVNSQSFLFHFDNFTLTVLLPLVIPNVKHGESGDLYLLPNVRKISSNSFKNSITKLLAQNGLVRQLLRISILRKVMGFKKLKLVPGNLYFFWGFCTYHGNGDCENGYMRSTALFHFHKPVKGNDFMNRFIATKKRSRVSFVKNK